MFLALLCPVPLAASTAGLRVRRLTQGSEPLFYCKADHLDSSHTAKMDTGHLSVSAPAGTKHKQVQDAKDMQRLITDRCNKNGTSVPPYEFLELIGKGSFGRVYKW